MNKRRNLITIGAATGLLLLIFDGNTAFSGTQEGVELCLRVLVPTLFPFLFFSNLLSSSLMGKKLPFLRPIGRLCRIPDGGEYIFLCGLLGGYPVGAQMISQAVTHGALSPADGRRMLGFCNNCGPAIIFGICSALFDDPIIPWLLMGIHVTSALITGMVLPGNSEVFQSKSQSNCSVVVSLNMALRSMAGICGWVILFKVLLAFCGRWIFWYLPSAVQIAFSGIMELSNGCIRLAEIEQAQLRFIFSAGFFAFGGLCVMMQTYFAARNVDTGLYFPGKLLQCCISIGIAGLLCGIPMCVLPGAAGVFLSIILGKSKNKGGNLRKVVV